MLQEYIAALNSSIGTPTYYWDLQRSLLHGSAGQVFYYPRYCDSYLK